LIPDEQKLICQKKNNSIYLFFFFEIYQFKNEVIWFPHWIDYKNQEKYLD